MTLRIARRVASGCVRCGECEPPTIVITWPGPSSDSMAKASGSGTSPPVATSPRITQAGTPAASGCRRAASPPSHASFSRRTERTKSSSNSVSARAFAMTSPSDQVGFAARTVTVASSRVAWRCSVGSSSQRLPVWEREYGRIDQHERLRSDAGRGQMGRHHRAPRVADDREIGPSEASRPDERGHLRRCDSEEVRVPPWCRPAVARHVECDDPSSGRCERRPEPPPGPRVGGHPVEEQERRLALLAPGRRRPRDTHGLDGAAHAGWRIRERRHDRRR